jgi:hypothetical protein
MKAISLWQPWATLWVTGEKIHETRHWGTSHRGPLLIHAAKTRAGEAELITGRYYLTMRQALRKHDYVRFCELPFGAIIGMVDLVDCIPTESVWPRLTNGEEAFGNFGPGRFAWRAENPRLFREPITFKGSQGFFNVPDELVAEALRRAA